MGQTASAGVDAVSDGIDGMKQLGGQMIDTFMPGNNSAGTNQSTPSPSNSNQANNAEPWKRHDQDLPPAWEEASKDKSWSNDL